MIVPDQNATISQLYNDEDNESLYSDLLQTF